MRSAVLLAWRYLVFHRVRSATLVICIALVSVLPVAVQVLVGHFDSSMRARARATPLLVGSKGSRFDLLLNALYFRGRVADTLTLAEVDQIQGSQLAIPVPVLVRHTVRRKPVVGTTLDYFEQRGLRVASGRLPVILGEAVVGAALAAELGLRPGDKVLSDVEEVYDLAAGYPLQMPIVGILDKSQSPDDGALFVDLKTAWTIESLCHGHVKTAEAMDNAVVLKRTDSNVVFNAALTEYVEITPDNIDTFHFHGDPSGFPITGILVWPADAKAATLLLGRYSVSKTAQMLVPVDVIDELLGFVFRAKRFFDANSLLVVIAAALFMTLIVILNLKIRQGEMETMYKIGCSRTSVFWMQGVELAILLGAGLAVAALASTAFYLYALEAHLVL